MTNWKKIGLGVLVVTAGLVFQGCTLLEPVADPTRFYLLDVSEYAPVSEVDQERVSIGLGRVQVSRYLDAPGITLREGENRVFHSQRHRWAESVEHGVSRLVAQTLRREPIVEQVWILPAQRRELADYELNISIFRSEGVRVGPEAYALFEAAWELRSGPEGAVIANGRVYEGDLSWDGADFDELIASLSQGVVEVSRQVAEALEEMR